MKRLLTILTLTVLLAYPSAACPVIETDFPVFAAQSPDVPAFEGRDCRIEDWKDHVRELVRTRSEVVEFDDARVDHDRRVRGFDRNIQLASLTDACSAEDVTRLTRLVLEANAINRGERKDLFWLKQRRIQSAIDQAAVNIRRLSLDLNSQCTGE
ncbi:hypothetical protein [Devosia alba]|uniref:hypothetical protein n=1 Tax=Devosia alba TaxID=3152360 RepID=UPI0032656A09